MSDELEKQRAALRWSDDELREIAHRLSHYRMSHGNLPITTLVPYTCDENTETIGVGYRHLENALMELLELRGTSTPEIEHSRDGFSKCQHPSCVETLRKMYGAGV
jgi:hypothetical protein